MGITTRPFGLTLAVSLSRADTFACAMTSILWHFYKMLAMCPRNDISRTTHLGMFAAFDIRDSYITALDHLLRPSRRDPYALHTAVRRVQHLELQPIILDHFALFRNPPSQFAHEAGNRRRLVPLRPPPKKLVQSIHIHAPRHYIGVLALLHQLRLLMLVADFADDLFHQVFDRHQACNAAVLVDDNRHAHIASLHLTEQIAPQLALRDKVNIFAHDARHQSRARFGIRHLKQVLRVENSLDVVNGAFIHGQARERLSAQQLHHLLDGRVGGHRHHLRTRLHRLAHRLAAELDHRLNQFPIPFLNNALFLSGFDERVHGFRWSFRLRFGALAR